MSRSWVIRGELAGDEPAIHVLTKAAFAPMSYSNGTEPAIINALRAAGDLSLSLVAEQGGKIVGQITFSPVTIDGVHDGWFGLGPVSVDPDMQGQGIGSALIKAGLDQIKADGAKGCVLVGNPDFYGRFGFVSDPGLSYGEVPIQYVQQLPLGHEARTGMLKYCEAFERTASAQD